MKEIVSVLQYLVENPVATFTTIMAVILIVTWFVFWTTRKVTKLSTAQEYLEKNHNVVLSCIRDLSEKVNVLSDSLNKISDCVSSLSIRMDCLSEQMNERFDQVDKRFEQVDKRFEQMEKRFEQVDKRFEKMDQRINNLSAQLHRSTLELRSDISYLKGEMKGTRERYTRPRLYDPRRRMVKRQYTKQI